MPIATAPPVSPHPGVPPTTKPPLTPILGPEVTSHAMAAVPCSPRTPVSTSSFSPLDPSLVSRGRPKQERWVDNSPLFSSGEASPEWLSTPSYRDVVLGSLSVALSAVGTAEAASADSPVPRDSPAMRSQVPNLTTVSTVVGMAAAALATPYAPRGAKLAPRETGWQKVESRRGRRRFQAARPRRPAPIKLAGRCFNCLSVSHFVSECCQRTRCFHCRRLGHRSYECLGRRDGGGEKQSFLQRTVVQKKVWRRITPTPGLPHVPLVKAATTGDEVLSTVAETGQAEGRSRRRRRPRKQRASNKEGQEQSPELVLNAPNMTGSPGCHDDDQASFPCIWDWNDRMTRAEDDLCTAVMITVISDRLTVQAEEIAALIAPRLEVEADSLVLRKTSNSSYVLLLPRVELATILTDRWSMLRAANFSIACKRWTRRMGSTGGLLPSLIDLELRGIPIHAWETSTVVQLLNPFAWVRQGHPDTLALIDLSAFRSTAWATDIQSIPAFRELWIVEPPTVMEDPPGKKTLVYPVEFRSSVSAIRGRWSCSSHFT
jgi:hypothetical protein